MSEFAVIIPCLNCLEVATKPCIESIKVSEDFDLIIVDNGSTDGTEEYFKNYAKEKNVEFIYLNGDEINLTNEEKQKSEQGVE